MTSKWKLLADEIQKRATPPTAKSDETPDVLVKRGPPLTAKSDETPLTSVLSVPTPSVLEKLEVAESAKKRLAQALFGTSANEAELELMVRREAYFLDKGFDQETCDFLIDRLMLRDRKHEDGHTCAECLNFKEKPRLCTQPRKARLSMASVASLPPEMISVPHQCRGFGPAIKSGP
jgi:hypothetical protein